MNLLPLSILIAAVAGSIAVLPGAASASGPRECDVNPEIQCPSNPEPIDQRPIDQSQSNPNGGQAVGGNSAQPPAYQAPRTSRVSRASVQAPAGSVSAETPAAATEAAPAEGGNAPSAAASEAVTAPDQSTVALAEPAPASVSVAGSSSQRHANPLLMLLGAAVAAVGGLALMVFSEQRARRSGNRS